MPLHVHQLICALIAPIGLGAAFVGAPHTFAPLIGTRLAHLTIDDLSTEVINGLCEALKVNSGLLSLNLGGSIQDDPLNIRQSISNFR